MTVTVGELILELQKYPANMVVKMPARYYAEEYDYQDPIVGEAILRTNFKGDLVDQHDGYIIDHTKPYFRALVIDPSFDLFKERK